MKINTWKILALAYLFFLILVISPFLFSISSWNLSQILSDISFTNTLIFTILKSLISTVVLVLFGFFGALILFNLPKFSFLGKSLSILIIPITLGNLTLAFSVKLLLGQSQFFSQIASGVATNKYIFLLFIELFQYGILFVYLFWIHLKTIDRDKVYFSKALGFSAFQKMKDIYLPHCKNLILLLCAISFVLCFYEESKVSFLFKVSEGTNSELITNWLNRTYGIYLGSSPLVAKSQIFSFSGVIFIAASIGFTLLYLSSNILILRISKSKIYGSKNFYFKKNSYSSRIWALILITIVTIPIILLFRRVDFSVQLTNLLFPLRMTLFASLITTIFSILFGIGVRLGWKETLQSFNEKSLIFFVILFLFVLIPPLVIQLVGFHWMSQIGYSSDLLIYLFWGVGHFMISMPLLVSIVFFNHFRVTNNELNYLKVHCVGSIDLLKFSFFKRFLGEYLLLGIIGFSFVWNEATLNNIFSDYIPSYVAQLKMFITGRGADYRLASSYLFISLFISFLSAVLWRYIIEQSHRRSSQL